MNYLIPFSFAFLSSLLLLLLVLHLFPRLGLMDRPHRYGLTRPPIPYPAGIILWLVFILGALLFTPHLPSLLGLILASSLLVLVSFLDDRLSLPPVFRFLVQILAALILTFFHIGVTHLNVPFYGVLDLTTYKIPLLGGNLTLLADLLTLLLIILFTNSMNWLDGSPGLPSGISFIASLVLFLLALRPDLHTLDQTTFATLAILLAGTTLAFLIFDFPPPRLLMGDTGSMFLGFTLGTLAILSGGKLATTLLILGVPLLDAFLVVLRRLLRRQLPWRGDHTHLHHRLLSLGLSPRTTAFIIYLLALLFGLSALFLSTIGKLFALLFLLFLFTIGEILLTSLLKKKNPPHPAGVGESQNQKPPSPEA